jgi:NADH:ubiquinone oxidoreductase subunit E
MLVYNRSQKETTEKETKVEKKVKPYNKGTGGVQQMGQSESINAEDTLLGPHLTLAQNQRGFLPEDAKEELAKMREC